jgi:hypothetical protein
VPFGAGEKVSVPCDLLSVALICADDHVVSPGPKTIYDVAASAGS